ncbi:MAG: hypothetical protein WCT53_04890 [Candidatus Gracilibacteria bacterium]
MTPTLKNTHEAELPIGGTAPQPQTTSPAEVQAGLAQVLEQLGKLGLEFGDRKREALDWQQSLHELCQTEGLNLPLEKISAFLIRLTSLAEGKENFATQFAGFDLNRMLDVLKKWEKSLAKDENAKETIKSLHAFYKIVETAKSNVLRLITSRCNEHQAKLIDLLTQKKAGGYVFFKEDEQTYISLKGAISTNDKNDDGLASYRQELAQSVKSQCAYLDISGNSRFNGFMSGCESYEYAQIIEKVYKGGWNASEDDYSLSYTGKWGFKRTFAGYSTCTDQRPIKQIIHESLGNGSLRVQNGDLAGECSVKMRDMYQWTRESQERIPIKAAVEILLGKRKGNVSIRISQKGKTPAETLAAFKSMSSGIPDDLISCW